MICGGIILCGGQSRRMGRPKAWLPFGGELMLPRIARILAEVVAPVVVVAAPDQELPPLPTGIQIVRDQDKDLGPLMGLAAGLATLKGKADAAYLSACDVPFLQSSFIRRMIELLGSDLIAVPQIGDFFHPLAAVYHLELLDMVLKLLREKRYKVSLLFDKVATRAVTAEELIEVDPMLKSLRNVNTPQEYTEALSEIESVEEM